MVKKSYKDEGYERIERLIKGLIGEKNYEKKIWNRKIGKKMEESLKV